MPEPDESSIHDKQAFISLVAGKIADGSEIFDDLRSLKQFLYNGGRSSTLPFLDMHFLKRQFDGIQIVRHIGMVQNMLDPEFYVSNVNGRSLHFRDYNPISSSNPGGNEGVEDFSTLAERQSLFIVPIPFTVDWFKELLAAKVGSVDERTRTAEPNMTSTSRKRERETVHSQNSRQRHGEAGIIGHMDELDSEISNQSTLPQSSVDWWPAGCNGSDECASPVLAKFYYDQYAKVDKHPTRLRLNDIVETIGVLSINPWEADFSSPGSSFEFDSPPPPPSQLPRLHVLAYRAIDLDTLAHEKLFASTGNAQETTETSLNSSLKRSLACEAIFLAMLSKAERKANAIQRMSVSAIGCTSLKVSTTLDSGVVFRRLRNVLNKSCPIVATVDLTSEEQHRFPAKSSGVISPTCWQLPGGSTLLIHLGDSRQESLDELLSSNQILYTFEGGVQILFEADFRVIVVSNNQNVKCSLHVSIEDQDLSLLEKEACSLRRTLALCRRVGNVELSSEVLERSQDDFLSHRSSARLKPQTRMPQEDDFHRWLCLTRLQARTRHSPIAITEDWEQAIALDGGLWNTSSLDYK